jgi:hypothetical protein
MNTAPDSVDQNGLTDSVAAFFTFGPGYTAGVYILTILGVLLMVGSIAAWMVTENRRLNMYAGGLARRLADPETESIPTPPAREDA